ncbi:hypothetical protein [Thermodesulfovibrio sp.]|uniref:hypothetical protein n=1 Tax=Thermodesulfovibrio sp. TaxID=2067987 RepID=UPI0030B14890
MKPEFLSSVILVTLSCEPTYEELKRSYNFEFLLYSEIFLWYKRGIASCDTVIFFRP